MAEKSSLFNSAQSYGWIAIVLHWIVALGVMGLFVLGVWMRDLDYGDALYQVLPHWHKSIGVLLVFTLVLRFAWRALNEKTAPLAHHAPWEKRVSKIVHYTLYALVFLMLPTGYFITTAEGQSLEVFSWFALPATVTSIENLESIAGDMHEIIAYTIMGLVLLHVLGALKHHFIDKDETLLRMLRVK